MREGDIVFSTHRLAVNCPPGQSWQMTLHPPGVMWYKKGMNPFSLLFIAVGLAMDAFAVSIASGFAVRKLHFRYAVKIAFLFGLFQGVMPVIGWLAGSKLVEYIAAIDHWIAFGLLSFVGGKMIYESTVFCEDEACDQDPKRIYVLLSLAIATSIDALAVGLTLSFINVNIVTPALIIGIITFTLSLAGVYIGDKVGHFFESKIEILGGIILIGIGIKILTEHLS